MRLHLIVEADKLSTITKLFAKVHNITIYNSFVFLFLLFSFSFSFSFFSMEYQTQNSTSPQHLSSNPVCDNTNKIYFASSNFYYLNKGAKVIAIENSWRLKKEPRNNTVYQTAECLEQETKKRYKT